VINIYSITTNMSVKVCGKQESATTTIKGDVCCSKLFIYIPLTPFQRGNRFCLIEQIREFLYVL
jgi:hypothetical protein